MTTTDLKTLANVLAAEHGEMKVRFKNDAQRYFNRTINAPDGHETELINLLFEMKTCRSNYTAIQDELYNRGKKVQMDSWRVLNDRSFLLAEDDILHSA